MRNTSRMGCTLAAFAALAGCPGDDGGSDTDATPTTSATSSPTTGVATDSGDPATTMAATDTGAPSTTSGADSTGSGSGSGSGSDSTGARGGIATLSNDGWVDNAEVFFQEGFIVDECWASTYVPEPDQYPFSVTAATMLVGGADKGSQDFYIGVWSVLPTGEPDLELAAGTANVNGDNNTPDVVPLDVIGATPAPITEGNFAIVVCMPNHAGFPSIARDHDGLGFADRNWIGLTDGTWISNETAGVAGDWIMRATIALE